MTSEQKERLVVLLWDYLRVDREHPDRVRTGWGAKTKEGLLASIETIMNDEVTEE